MELILFMYFITILFTFAFELFEIYKSMHFRKFLICNITNTIKNITRNIIRDFDVEMSALFAGCKDTIYST